MTMKDGVDRLKQGLRTLHPVRLEETDDWGLSEEDLTGALVGNKSSMLVFGYFPASRLLGDMEERGMLRALRARQYSDFELRSDGDSAFENRVRLYASHPEAEERCVLMDVRTHKGELTGGSEPLGRELRIRALIWEWLSFQDPLRSFPPGFDALPGQEHPGLGIFRPSVNLMLDYVREMDVDALVGLPQYFHNAVLYSSHFRFFSPRLEGEFLALRRDLLPEGLARCSRGLAEGGVVERGTDRRIAWHAAEQVYPLNGEIKDHFAHPAYLEGVRSAQETMHFRFA